MSHQKKMGRGFFIGKRGKLMQNLGWRVKLFYTCDWVMEHTSFVTGERYVFLSPEKVQFSALFFPFCNLATIQWF